MTKKESIPELREKLHELYHIGSAIAVLHWDMEVFMPPKGAASRAKTIANLSGILHEKFISKEFAALLQKAKEKFDAGKLSDEESAIVRELWREYERQKKLPLAFVKEMSQVCSEGHNVWIKAREKSDFRIFLPVLKKIVALKRREAELVGFKKSPYDALLDTYEPGATSEDISMIFEELKNFLVPFLKKISKAKGVVNPNILKGNFPIEKQKKFDEEVAKKLGFDFEAGRLDTSAHPFSTGFHPRDVRITTRYRKNDLFDSFFGVIHETGHALYEQALDAKHFGTPLGESISHGIHESQSRMWENTVARSKNFWKYFFPRLQSRFPNPFAKMKFEDFYRAINSARPSLIRVEADEVTYSLHIILRFEIEKELIEGSIEVEDLPKIWNAKMKEYLGVKVSGDANGVLQDVHWSGGGIGYFPSYTLGNLYAAQFYNTAKKDILNLEEEIAAGEFSHLREWLRRKIHVHGKMFSADSLVREVTGEPLTSQYFMDYLKKKYGEIYGIKNMKIKPENLESATEDEKFISADGKEIFLTEERRKHLRAHYDVMEFLEEAISKVRIPGGAAYFEEATAMGRNIGITILVKTKTIFPEEETDFSLRVGREWPVRVSLDSKGESCDSVTLEIKFDKQSKKYFLNTAYIGFPCPDSPYHISNKASDQYKEALDFWCSHALAYDPKIMEKPFKSSWSLVLAGIKK